MAGGMSFEKEDTRRFFEGAKVGLDDLRKSRAKRLRQTPRFFEGARQGLYVLRPAILELDRHLARKFDFFRFIYLDENRMSAVFAYLLDPDETHGQRELFLREFLSNVSPKWISGNRWPSVRISREVRTTRIEDWDRRIDIEISSLVDGDWAAIAIENKPCAGDQDKQLSDYARHLESMYEGRFKLIYLTPYGTDPSPNSIPCKERKELAEKGKFEKGSIQDWASDNGWLKRSEDQVKAEQVRWFVSHFREALKESLPEPEEAAEQQM